MIWPRALRFRAPLAWFGVAVISVGWSPTSAGGAPARWLSPSALAAAPDGRTLFVACATGQSVLMVDLPSRQVTGSLTLPGSPSGLAISADGKTLWVTCAGPESRVCAIDTDRRQVATMLPAGHTALSPVLSPDGRTLFVCNRFNDDVSVIDLAGKQKTRRIPVRREPVAAAITPDGKRLLVANFLPAGRADADHVGAVVSVIDPAAGAVIDDLWLPSGSGSLQDIRISPDGGYAVVTLVLARFQFPTRQIERGWINANAIAVLALDRMEVIDTVLLDEMNRGGANPWGVAWSADGRHLVVAHAGTHEVSIADFPALVDELKRYQPSPETAAALALPYGTRGLAAPPATAAHDLNFIVGLRERRPLPAGDLGPRAVVVVGHRAYTANHFSDTLSVIGLDGAEPRTETLPLGPPPRLNTARLGEHYFNNARLCVQGWQSCASCHPGDARADGLNWDLLNDGEGNPKNTRSLLLAFRTPPAMSLGVRETAAEGVRAGIRHILFTIQPPDVAEAIDAYLQSLTPVRSPHLAPGGLSPAAKRGQELFQRPDVGCAACHPGPLYTDLHSYDVGTRGRFDGDQGVFDTPTLVEIWRTAPYLHDGSAKTLHDVLIAANHRDQHGKTSHLTAEQVNDLLAYLLSL